MTNNAIHSNVALSPPPPAQNEYTPRCPMRDVANAALETRPLKVIQSGIKWSQNTAGWALKHVRYLNPWNKTEEPHKALKDIDKLARRGLKFAKENNVKIIDIPGLQANLDEKLQQTRPTTTKTRTLIEAKPEGYWDTETEKHRTKICELVSATIILTKMSNACGLPQNDFLIKKLAKKATGGDETLAGASPQSVWKVFTEAHNLSFFSKIKAAWWYWVGFKSSVTSKTVDTYVKAFLHGLTKDLKDEKSTARDELISIILQDTNRFLVNDIKASKKASEETTLGTPDDHRNNAIAATFKYSLKEQVERFIKKRIDKDQPEVKFFEFTEKWPVVIRWSFEKFQWFVNRYFIQSYMKSMILPDQLEAGVVNGLKATELDKSPFSLVLTRFMTTRLEQLRDILDDPSKLTFGEGQKEETQVNGTKLLSTTIKNLRTVLDLEPNTTAIDLRRKFEEMEKASKDGKNELNWYSVLEKVFRWEDEKLEQTLEQGAVTSGTILFDYLNQAAKSGEMVATLLERSLDYFSTKEETQAQHEAECRQEQLKLERLSGEIFNKMIEVAVEMTTSVDGHKKTENTATSSFNDRKTIATTTLAKLTDLSDRMKAKVDQEANKLHNETEASKPTEENNVQTDISAFLQIMQVFANRTEIQDKLKSLSDADRNEIWRIITPLYERAAEIQEKILTLQEFQKNYSINAAAVSHLNDVSDHLKKIKDDVLPKPIEKPDPSKPKKKSSYPEPFCNSLIHDFKTYEQAIAKTLGDRDSTSVEIFAFSTQISNLLEIIQRERQVLQAVNILAPVTKIGEAPSTEDGLLKQLLNYYENKPIPKGFKPHECRKMIEKCLDQFPQDEKQELTRLIGRGQPLRKNWGAISAILLRIYGNQEHQHTAHEQTLKQKIDEASKWIQERRQDYSSARTDNFSQLQETMNALSKDVKTLSDENERAELNFSAFAPSYAALGAGAAAITSLASLGVEPLVSMIPVVGPYVGPVVGLLSRGSATIASVGSYPASQNYGAMRNGKMLAKVKTVAQTGGLLLAGAAATAGVSYIPLIGSAIAPYVTPCAAQIVGSTIAGYCTGMNANNAITNYGKERVQPKVKAIFDNLKGFIRHPRVWTFGARDALDRLG